MNKNELNCDVFERLMREKNQRQCSKNLKSYFPLCVRSFLALKIGPEIKHKLLTDC